MATFVVIPIKGKDNVLNARVQGQHPRALQLPRGEWLVRYNGTSKQLSDSLGLSDNKLSCTGIVLNVSSYWGFGPKSLWEWLEVNGNG